MMKIGRRRMFSSARLFMEQGWLKRLEPEVSKEYFQDLHVFLDAEKSRGVQVFPPKRLVFAAFDHCPFDKTKVVIIGQDPYHGKGQAHGLAFSVDKKVSIPPSLRNIFKEAMADVGIPPPLTGDLTPWAAQGVLLLNSVLTVRKGEANSHQQKGWEKFTDRAIRALNDEKEGLVFMLWGNHAQAKGSIVDREKHLVITSSHPSPIAAFRSSEPFLGSKCFSRTNEYLVSKGKDPIDWTLQ